MKYRNYLFVLSLLLIGISCAKDKGNYDYSSLNDVTINEFNKGEPYIRTIGKIVEIEPDMKFKLVKDENAFSYLWIIGKDSVSTQRNLNYTIPDGSACGKLECSYVVENKSNGMKYFQRFIINVVNPFNFGYYILCKGSDNSSSICYVSYDAESDKSELLTTNMIGNYKIGNNPSHMSGSFGMIDALDEYYWIIHVATKEGEYPAITTECATFLPMTLYSQNGFADQQTRNFSPEKVLTSQRNETYFLSNGQIIRSVAPFLYRPAIHKENYYWSDFSIATFGLCMYDKLTNKFFIANPAKNDPVAGTVGDIYAMDAITPVKSCPDFSDSKIVDYLVVEDYDNLSQNHIIASVSSKGIAIDTVAYDSNLDVAEFRKGIVITGAPISASSCGVRYNTSDWFFTAGNVIYSSPDMLHKLTKFVDIPSELGDIKEIKISTKNTYLAVTTYNKDTNKGSFVLVNIQSKKMSQFKEVMSEPISLLCADGNPWW